MKKLQITCIIPSLCAKQSLTNLLTCISSIRVAERKANCRVTIMVVTNSRKVILGPAKKEIKYLIKLVGKFDFSRMNNKAIDLSINKTDSDWLLFINDDAYIDKDFFVVFKRLIVAKKPDIISPLIKRTDGNGADSFGVNYFMSGYAANSRDSRLPTALSTACVEVVSMDFAKAIIKTYGYFFNPILGSYYEDVEFSIRALGRGGKIIKDKNLIAYHYGSFSSGFRSRYVIKQSYRNALWIILLTWPLRLILKKVFWILLLQLWFQIYALFKYGPGFYREIFLETVTEFRHIMKVRKETLSKYRKNFNLEKHMINNHIYRMGRGWVI